MVVESLRIVTGRGEVGRMQAAPPIVPELHMESQSKRMHDEMKMVRNDGAGDGDVHTYLRIARA